MAPRGTLFAKHLEEYRRTGSFDREALLQDALAVCHGYETSCDGAVCALLRDTRDLVREIPEAIIAVSAAATQPIHSRMVWSNRQPSPPLQMVWSVPPAQPSLMVLVMILHHVPGGWAGDRTHPSGRGRAGLATTHFYYVYVD